MLIKSNDNGVSAIIGVIMIVAITVVLAAIIAEFGLQFNNDLQKHYNIGVKIERTSDTVVVVKTIAGDTYMLKTGGTDHHTRADATYKCMVNGAQVFPVTNAGIDVPDLTGNFDASLIGSYMYFRANTNDDITIIAQYTDQTEMVIFSGKAS